MQTVALMLRWLTQLSWIWIAATTSGQPISTSSFSLDLALQPRSAEFKNWFVRQISRSEPNLKNLLIAWKTWSPGALRVVWEIQGLKTTRLKLSTPSSTLIISRLELSKTSFCNMRVSTWVAHPLLYSSTSLGILSHKKRLSASKNHWKTWLRLIFPKIFSEPRLAQQSCPSLVLIRTRSARPRSR